MNRDELLGRKPPFDWYKFAVAAGMIVMLCVAIVACVIVAHFIRKAW